MAWQEEPRESPHPEVDRLFAAGTPVPRIAELTGFREGTVRRHIERRRRVDPNLVAARDSAPRGASVTFYRNRDALRTFVAKYARYPRKQAIEPGEKPLYVFLSEQRSAFLRQELSWEKAAALGVLGDWITTDDEVEREHRWHQRLAEVVAFVDVEGRLPRHRETEGVEHTLGLWVVTQNNETAAGRISAERLETLAAAFPGWRRRGVMGDG